MDAGLSEPAPTKTKTKAQVTAPHIGAAGLTCVIAAADSGAYSGGSPPVRPCRSAAMKNITTFTATLK